MLNEITTVAAILPADLAARHIHFGGGSPSILSPLDIGRIGETLHSAFNINPDAEIAVEIDPRYIDDDRIAAFAAFAAIGVNRLSCGVQDFDITVQDAINRHQSFEQTEATIAAFRRAGIASVNVDLVYGLPRQTRESVDHKITKVLKLAPDRIALFGYAHLPSRITHQRLINTAELPDAIERLAQSNQAASRPLEAGYVCSIGLDHFARPQDPLASGSTTRNFQGYTTDDADTLLGFGASAISKLTEGHVQNAVATADYIRRTSDGGLATARGLALDDEDRARAYVINALMCHLNLCTSEFRGKFAGLADPLLEEASALTDSDRDGFFVAIPDGFAVTERGRPFLRTICSRFDAYLGNGQATHSTGV